MSIGTVVARSGLRRKTDLRYAFGGELLAAAVDLHPGGSGRRRSLDEFHLADGAPMIPTGPFLSSLNLLKFESD